MVKRNLDEELEQVIGQATYYRFNDMFEGVFNQTPTDMLYGELLDSDDATKRAFLKKWG